MGGCAPRHREGKRETRLAASLPESAWLLVDHLRESGGFCGKIIRVAAVLGYDAIVAHREARGRKLCDTTGQGCRSHHTPIHYKLHGLTVCGRSRDRGHGDGQ